MSQNERYGVFGNPIKHSKSPQIHRQFAKDLDQPVSYDPYLIEEGCFEQEARRFFNEGGKGLNITVPFKENAYALTEKLSDRARRAGAVNTLYCDETGAICGDNTDGVGMMKDIQVNNGVEVAGRSVLLLGAGGAVRGVMQPLLAAGPSCVVISNRTQARADGLVEEFAELVAEGQTLSACSFEALAGQSFDLVINGTSASLQGDLPPLPTGLLNEGAVCYDMMYGAEPTPFLVWSAQNGAVKNIDGLGMLVEQAAESFRIWRGVSPDGAPVIEIIRAQLG